MEPEALPVNESARVVAAAAGEVRALDPGVAQRICSGQVVTGLCGAVKELVDNALDAGATRIEVRLFDAGLRGVEVSDNGSGVPVGARGLFMQRSSTSKITRFEDIELVRTHGFRGEALAALLELCRAQGGIEVTTRSAEEPTAQRMTFERGSGRLQCSRPSAREQGTTVALRGLFEQLPVRRREFERTIKQQLAKTLLQLQGYAIITPGVKLACVNIEGGAGLDEPAAAGKPGGAPQGRRKVLLQTQGAAEMRANIAAVCGGQLAAEIVPVNLTFASRQALAQADARLAARPASSSSFLKGMGLWGGDEEERGYLEDDQEEEKGWGGEEDEEDVEDQVADAAARAARTAVKRRTAHFAKPAQAAGSASGSGAEESTRLEGFASRLGEGIGMSSGDRQFWFVNGRPVDWSKGSKVLNSVWRSRDMKAKPAFFLDLRVPRGEVDVNLTPDKREVFLANEELLLAQLRPMFEQVWARGGGPAAGSVQQSLREHFQAAAPEPQSQPQARVEERDDLEQPLNIGGGGGVSKRIVATKAGEVTSAADADPDAQPAVDDAVDKQAAPAGREEEEELDALERRAEEHDVSIVPPPSSSRRSGGGKAGTPAQAVEVEDAEVEQVEVEQVDEGEQEGGAGAAPRSGRQTRLAAVPAVVHGVAEAARAARREVVRGPESPPRKRAREAARANASIASAEETVEYPALRNSGLAAICAELQQQAAKRRRAHAHAPADAQALESAAEGADGGGFLIKDVNGEVAERLFLKRDFARTEVIGQFNLGFIVGRCDGELYIFDQHACDEKFRFETFARSAALKMQPLIRPFPLELSATDAQILRDNMDVFEANGFRFAPDVEADEEPGGAPVSASAPGQGKAKAKRAATANQMRLTAVPHGLRTEFGAEDARELASLLRDSPPPAPELRAALGWRPPRPPRVRDVLASRACRSAIMIGRALRHSEMVRELRNMVGLDQPWNCPHGRPTMRHLAVLAELAPRRGSAGEYLLFE